MAVSEPDSVHQLRHDILSAMFWYHHTWGSCLESQPDTNELAYNNLPRSSPLIWYLILITAYYWVPKHGLDAEVIDTLHPHFLVDVLLKYAHKASTPGDNETSATKAFAKEVYDCMLKSCAFHAHLVHDRPACRQRLINVHIFKGLNIE
jgi:hypothetical protein